ncbi:MAG: hypothetical protein DSY41_02235, partial [Candidatus Poseidoniales archaeon]
MVLLFLLPIVSPIASVSGEARIESQNFEILDRLSEVLEERQEALDSNSVGQMAGPTIEGISRRLGGSSVPAPTPSSDTGYVGMGPPRLSSYRSTHAEADNLTNSENRTKVEYSSCLLESPMSPRAPDSGPAQGTLAYDYV